MQIIQNLEAIQIGAKSDKRIYFPVETIKDKIINSFVFFNPPHQEEQRPYIIISSPYDEKLIGNTVSFDYFFNCFDNQDHHFIQDLPIDSPLLGINEYYNLNIQRIINFDKSHIRVLITQNETNNSLLLVSYQTQPIQPFDNNFKGSMRVEFSVTENNKDLCLKDIVPKSLQGKKIKQIKNGGNSYFECGYLDLVGLDGKRIKNIPVRLLSSDLYFDNINIDYENSYYRERGYYDEEGLVNENNELIRNTRLTFIY